MNNNNKFSVPAFVMDVENNHGTCNIVTKSGMTVPVIITKIDALNRGPRYAIQDQTEITCMVIQDTIGPRGVLKAKDVSRMSSGSIDIKKVIFNDPVTVVIWSDGQKSIVRAQNGEPFDPEKGLALAIAKRALGNTSSYYEVFKKFVPSIEEEIIDKLAAVGNPNIISPRELTEAELLHHIKHAANIGRCIEEEADS